MDFTRASQTLDSNCCLETHVSWKNQTDLNIRVCTLAWKLGYFVRVVSGLKKSPTAHCLRMRYPTFHIRLSAAANPQTTLRLIRSCHGTRQCDDNANASANSQQDLA